MKHPKIFPQILKALRRSSLAMIVFLFSGGGWTKGDWALVTIVVTEPSLQGQEIQLNGLPVKVGVDGIAEQQVSAGAHRLTVTGFSPLLFVAAPGEQILLNLKAMQAPTEAKPQLTAEEFRHQPESLQSSQNVVKGPMPTNSTNSLAEEQTEIVVLAPKVKGSMAALVEIRRTQQQVAEVMGSEQMARQGDSDAASNLRRVTGLSLVGGKYVYVRGLGERYSAVRLNGFQLPSPEPSRRVVPLDLFPVGILESVVVQKSFSAEQPADFGGGLIALKTRSLPEQPFARVSLTSDLSAPGRYKSYRGGDRDVWGEDDGTRAMPANIASQLASGRKFNEASSEELAQLGATLNNNYDITEKSFARIPSLTLGLGGRTQWGAQTLGAALGLMHSEQLETQQVLSQKFNVGSGGRLERSEQASTTKDEIERKISAQLDLGVERKSQSLRFTQIFLRNSTDTTSLKEFSQAGDRYQSRNQRNLDFVARDLNIAQLSGEHPLTGDKTNVLQWRLGQSVATRRAPDAREVVYVRETDQSPYEYLPDATGNRRVYSELFDRSSEAGLEFNKKQIAGWPLNVGLGWTNIARSRVSDTYRLHLQNNFPSGQRPDFTQPPEQLFSQKNICPQCFVLTNLTNSADSYVGEQRLQALYGQMDWSPSPQWNFQLGLREEKSRQEVRTFFYFERDRPTSVAGIDNLDWLPAYALNWRSKNEALQIRTAYSETVARPDFRELSTVEYFDDSSGYYTVGNRELRSTVIRNIDHRWEYYFSGDEYASVGVFQKEFTLPIEEIFEPSPNLRKTFANAESATNRGVELETKVDLRHLGRGLRRWSFLGNVSLIDSQVSLAESAQSVQTNSARPLQGQSPYMINLQLHYTRPFYGIQGSLLFNRIGRRITEVGTSGRPDIFEEPFDQVDFVFSHKISKMLQWQLRARNLLDPEARSVQGDEVVKSTRKGRSIYVGLSATL